MTFPFPTITGKESDSKHIKRELEATALISTQRPRTVHSLGRCVHFLGSQGSPRRKQPTLNGLVPGLRQGPSDVSDLPQCSRLSVGRDIPFLTLDGLLFPRGSSHHAGSATEDVTPPCLREWGVLKVTAHQCRAWGQRTRGLIQDQGQDTRSRTLKPGQKDLLD